MTQPQLSMRTIETLHRQKKEGKVIDKWDSCLPIYDHLYRPRMDDAIDLLEIGIQNGGSLEIWSQFFDNTRRIVGCDINSRCANLKYSDDMVSVVVGNANSPEIHARITQISGQYDFIIDDGSHTSDVIRKAMTATHAKDGRRLMTGKDAIADDSIFKDNSGAPLETRPAKGPLKRLRKLWTK